MAEEGKALYVQIGQFECSLHSQETHEKPATVILYFSGDIGGGA